MDFFFSTRTPLARLPFAIRLVIVLLVGTGISYLAFKAGYKFLHFTEVGVFFAIITGSITAWTALVQVIRRLRDLEAAVEVTVPSRPSARLASGQSVFAKCRNVFPRRRRNLDEFSKISKKSD